MTYNIEAGHKLYDTKMSYKSLPFNGSAIVPYGLEYSFKGILSFS